MDKENFISTLEELTETLNFRRVVLITLLLIISIFLFIGFDNREIVFSKVFQSRIEGGKPVDEWTLSDKSKNSLIQLTKVAPISYVGIIDVDLKKNRRSLKYRYINNSELQSILEKHNSSLLPQAVFDYDAKNTQQMVSILSNEFSCAKTQDTVFFRWFPEVVKTMPSICRLAIPPFVGQFVGFVVIGINQQISKSEMDSIRLEVSRIAVEIYLRDVIKKSKI